MKKTGLAVLMLAVTSAVAFAQQGSVDYDEIYHSYVGEKTNRPAVSSSQKPSALAATVTRAVVQSTRKKKADEHKVRETLQKVRVHIHNLQRDDSGAIMQSIASLADVFLDEISENSRTQTFVAKKDVNVGALVAEINKPMRAGWKIDNFSIAEGIEDFLSYRYHEQASEDFTREMQVFLDVLKAYPYYEDMHPQFRNQLMGFRHYVANASEENMPVIMQSLVFLADTYFDKYAKNPQAKTEPFVAKNPELAASVAREMDEAMPVGWADGETLKPSDYISEHIYEWDQVLKDKAPAEELDAFVKALLAAQKK